MSGRHSIVPERNLNRRLAGAGASGLALVLAVAPFAHADQAVPDAASTSSAPGLPASSSDAPDSASPNVPNSAAPASDGPSSGTPSSDAPLTGDTPSSAAPSSDAPATGISSSDAPSTGGTPSDGPTGAAPTNSAPAAAPTAKAPAGAPLGRAGLADYGYGKASIDADVTVRVEQAPGSYAPAGAGTAGSTVTLVENDSTGAVVSTRECTTVADPAPSNGSSCDGTYALAGGDTMTLTQTSTGAHFVNGAPQTIGPYECDYYPFGDEARPADVPCFVGTIPVTVVIDDQGLPPTVRVASTDATVAADAATEVNVDESQIDTDGAPPTSVDVTTEPEHGTVAVVSDSTAVIRAAVDTTAVTGAFHFVYTPTAGYLGPDSFQYAVTTANGTSGAATVALKVVGAAPTLRDDSTATRHGTAVVDDVLANDDANDGGTLALDSITPPQHGSAEIVDGRVRYTPAPDFSGTDTFTYAASTYSGAGTATVTIRVAAAAVTPTSTTPTTPTPTTSTSTSADVLAAPDGGGTAETGTPSAALIEIGGALLLAGAGATAIGRRRRPGGGHA